MTRLLVLVSGLPLSGKTTLARLLSNRLNAPMFSLGDVIREEASKLNRDPGEVASLLRVREGRRVVASRLAEKIRNVNSDVIIIEGVRSIEEVQELCEKLHAVPYLIYVVSSRPVREKRLRARGRTDDVTLCTVTVRDLREAAYGLTELIVYADKIVVNDFENVSELEREVEAITEDIRRSLSRQ